MVSDEWLTPRFVLDALGPFDLDPCAPVVRPWPTAREHYTIEDNGLLREWFGRVWLNPPYGREMERWLERMAVHQKGVALIFARTETEAFHRLVWPTADSILFLKGRLTFCDTTGTPAAHNGGAPSVLIAYGEENVAALADSGLQGKHLLVNAIPMVVVAASPSWRAVVTIAIKRLNGKASLEELYRVVEHLAPDKVERNRHWKEKIRQKVQQQLTRIDKGYYISLMN